MACLVGICAFGLDKMYSLAVAAVTAAAVTAAADKSVAHMSKW